MTVHGERKSACPVTSPVELSKLLRTVRHSPEDTSKNASWINRPCACSSATAAVLTATATSTGKANGSPGGVGSTTTGETDRIPSCWVG
eukprot:639889-Rhodomonas_salina.3